ncbi:hypothetical protein [Streptomyces sp. NPDC050988]|uniref:hypothetical protein n=1 Tax=Streptomyces sp. NPDC050988 TaxID=3365637 RepID=UPI0037A913A1
MSETSPEGPVSVEPPPGMGPNGYEYWDVETRTYYERQDDGTVITRPYNEAENQQANAAANRAVLVDCIKGMTVLLSGDIASNKAFAALPDLTSDEGRAQVDALTAQSNRQAEMLAAIARLSLGRFESVEVEIQ